MDGCVFKCCSRPLAWQVSFYPQKQPTEITVKISQQLHLELQSRSQNTVHQFFFPKEAGLWHPVELKLQFLNLHELVLLSWASKKNKLQNTFLLIKDSLHTARLRCDWVSLIAVLWCCALHSIAIFLRVFYAILVVPCWPLRTTRNFAGVLHNTGYC